MPKTANLYTVFGLTNIKAMWWPYKETISQPKYNLNKLTNTWHLNFHEQSNTLSGNLQEQEEGKQIQFSEVQMPAIASYFFPINGQSLARFLKGQSIVPFHVQGESYSCQLYKDVAKTYQSQVIPAQLDDCFHVMTGDYTKDYSFQILARALSKTQPQGAKELKVQYLNTNMVMTQSGPNNYRFIVNGSEQALPHSTSMAKDIVDRQGNLVAVLYRYANDI